MQKEDFPISSKLKELLDNMTKDEFEKAWDNIQKMELSGPSLETISQMLNQIQNEHIIYSPSEE